MLTHSGVSYYTYVSNNTTINLLQLTQSFSDVLIKKSELVLSSNSNPTSSTPPTLSDKPPVMTAAHSVAQATSDSNRITSTPVESTRLLSTSIGLSAILSHKSYSIKTVDTLTASSLVQALSDGEPSSLPSLPEHLEQIETPRCVFQATSAVSSSSSVVVLDDSPVTMVTKSEHAPSKKRSSSQSDSEVNPTSTNSLSSNISKQSSLTNGAASDEGQSLTYTPHKQSILCLKVHTHKHTHTHTIKIV